jgi:hypothetical protein
MSSHAAYLEEFTERFFQNHPLKIREDREVMKRSPIHRDEAISMGDSNYKIWG